MEDILVLHANLQLQVSTILFVDLSAKCSSFVLVPNYLYRGLETVHIIFCIDAVYFYLVTGFGDLDKLNTIPG